ncbi:ABC transporter ATP-binding protein [Pikeienuella piscinae]|uniref:ABC transporter ATP-binding protein n=1 Tax=Pikeienuella piscinae TaxID=2748098 RepID=A0A7L5C1T2_9RHOB|nr:ABC transporter ATP-binding protein [Pikeienuella piscinae]QIE56777.1 ABC transporter ATP-binding protein [Pikeienuella piscinae]
MNASPFLSLDGVSKRWNDQLGVEDINLSVPEGDFVALLGPSGCGKSTTLRLIAGLETPDQGAVSIGGADVTASPASKRNLSMVFQSYALFPHLDVAENILFGLKVRRTPRPEQKVKLARALKMTGLEGLEQRKPGEISGGQRQRVALARAIVAGHPLCLMDEPLSNLDAKLRHSVRRDIKRIQRELGMTVLYVTHDQTEAMSMADIVVLMKDGRIEQAGRPAELYNEPASTFVASFVGSPPMALIEAEALPRLADGRSVIFGVRPEDLSIVEPGEGALKATVTECEYMGAETFLSFAHPNANGLTVRIAGEATRPAGETVELSFPKDRLHVFDRETGRRIAGTAQNPPATGRKSPRGPIAEERDTETLDELPFDPTDRGTP